MSVFDEHAESLEKHEFMMGPVRGKLAVSMDILTDALILAGQHGAYVQMQTKTSKLPMDIRLIIKSIEQAKELIFQAMEDAKRKSE